MEETELKSLRDSQRSKLAKKEVPAQRKPETDESPAPAATVTEKKPNKIARFLTAAILVFVIGGIGGIWLDRVLLPTLLVRYPALNQYDILKRMNERTTIVRETEEIRISQEEAISDTIEKVSPSVVDILGKNAAGADETIGSGIILTSDGYLITPLKNIYVDGAPGKEIRVRLKNDKIYTATVTGQETNYSLAMLKISENNLSVIPYANSDDLKLGQKLVIINGAVTTDIVSNLIDNYIMPGSTDSSLQKRIKLSHDLGQAFSGSAVIDIEGKLVGIGQEADIVIPLSEIRSFIDKGTAE